MLRSVDWLGVASCFGLLVSLIGDSQLRHQAEWGKGLDAAPWEKSWMDGHRLVKHDYTDVVLAPKTVAVCAICSQPPAFQLRRGTPANSRHLTETSIPLASIYWWPCLTFTEGR